MASSSAGYQTNEQSVSPPSPTTKVPVRLGLPLAGALWGMRIWGGSLPSPATQSVVDQ